MHQSTPGVPIPPPSSLGNHGTFAQVVSPMGHSQFYHSLGAVGISVPWGDPWAFDTHVFERWMSLSGRTRPLSKTGLSVRD